MDCIIGALKACQHTLVIAEDGIGRQQQVNEQRNHHNQKAGSSVEGMVFLGSYGGVAVLAYLDIIIERAVFHSHGSTIFSVTHQQLGITRKVAPKA